MIVARWIIAAALIAAIAATFGFGRRAHAASHRQPSFGGSAARRMQQGPSLMTPVDQDRLHIPGVQNGNCQQAATASILGLDLADVPNFAEARFFWDAFRRFLLSRGFIAVDLPARMRLPGRQACT